MSSGRTGFRRALVCRLFLSFARRASGSPQGWGWRRFLVLRCRGWGLLLGRRAVVVDDGDGDLGRRAQCVGRGVGGGEFDVEALVLLGVIVSR